MMCRTGSTKWVHVVLLIGVVTVSGCGGDDNQGTSSSAAPPTAAPVEPTTVSEAPATPPDVAETPSKKAAIPPITAEGQQPGDPVVQQPLVAEQSRAFAPAADPQAFAKPTTPPSQSKEATVPAGVSPFETSYLDPTTELFVFARPAAIASSPIVRALSGGKLGPAGDFSESFGIGVDQIESVTIGVSHLQQMDEQVGEQLAVTDPSQAGMVPSLLPAFSRFTEHTVAVIRTTEPVSLEELKLPNEDGFVKSHGSKSYYQLMDIGERSPHGYAAGVKTFVVASEAVIQAIIDQGETPSHATADLSFVSADSHLLVAIVPQDREAFFAGLPAIPTPEPPTEQESPTAQEPKPGEAGFRMSEEDEDEEGKGKNKKSRKDDDDEERTFSNLNLRIPDSSDGRTQQEAIEIFEKSEWQKLLETHATGLAFSVDLNAGLKARFSAQCDVPASPLRIQKELEAVIVRGRQMFDAIRGVLPGLVQEIAGAMVDSLAVTVDGTVVSASTTLPESQQANLTMLPMVVMGMMMSQAGNVEVVQQMVDWEGRAQEVLDRGQASVVREGVPQGLEVHGLARWSLPQPGHELSPPLLELAIVCAGGPGEFVKSFGLLKVNEAEVTTDVPLKWLGVSRNGRIDDPVHQMVVVDREIGFSPHPAGGIATGVLFHPPGDEVRSLAVISGQIDLEVPTSSREVELPNVSAGAGSIDDPILQSANLVVSTEASAGQMTVRCHYNRGSPIGRFVVLDASGNAVEASGSSEIVLGEQVQREWQIPEKTRQPLGLAVTVFENMQEISLPFRFENMPMPEQASRFPGQEPLGSWTAAVQSSDFPEGLTLEGQARWKAPQFSEIASLEGNGPSAPPAASTPPKISLTGRGGGLGFGKGRDEEDEDPQPANGGGGGLSRKEEKRQRKGKKDEEDEVPEFRAGVRVADDYDGQTMPAVRTSEPKAALMAGSLDGRLQMVVDLTGPTVDSTVVIGELQVESAIGEGGVQLDYDGGQFGQLDVTNDLAEVEWDKLSRTDQPPNGLRVIYKFVRPDSPIRLISELKGSLLMRTVRERIEAIVPNLQDRVEKRIKDRILTKYGIEIAVAIDEGELKYRTLKGDEKRFDKFFPVDGNGARIDGVSHVTTTENGNQIHVFQFARDVPEEVGLKFIINLGVQDIEVPVEFINVPVPPAPLEAAIE